MNELEYAPDLGDYRYIVPDVQPGDVLLTPRAQCDDMVLVKRIARVYGGDTPQTGTGKAGAATTA